MTPSNNSGAPSLRLRSGWTWGKGGEMASPRPNNSRKPTARSKRRELMSRAGVVHGWDASVFVRAESQHGAPERKPMLVLELRGELSEPVKKVGSFKVRVFAEAQPAVGASEIPSVGSVLSMEGSLDAVVQLADREFQLVAAMATAGRLTLVHLCFQEPRYGSALIASCSFDTREPDEQ